MNLRQRVEAAAGEYLLSHPAAAGAALRVVETTSRVRGAAAAVAAAFPETPAGQAVAEFRQDLRTELGYAREDLADTVAEIRADVADTVAEVRADFAEVRAEVTDRVSRAVATTAATVVPVAQAAREGYQNGGFGLF